MLVASVVLDIPTQALDDAFSYFVPPHLQEYAQVGCAVVVEFGRQQAIGFIVSLVDTEDNSNTATPSQKLKPILSVESKSYFGEEAATTAKYISEHYLAPLSTCVRLFVPTGAVPKIRKVAGVWAVEKPNVGEVDDRWVSAGANFAEFKPRKGAYKQIAVMEAVANGDVRVSELTAEYGQVNAALHALEVKGAISVEERRRMRNEQANEASKIFAQTSGTLTLTEGQQAALQCINKALSAADGQVVLVNGVTGSGKTEVYLQAIQNVLDFGKNACVLVPEISLTPQTVARFRGRFGNLVAVLHSKMSQGERYDQWDFIQSGVARVVVGARSALFSPLKNIGIYVIDEEHESSYKQDSAPHYHARDVAAYLAKTAGAVLVLGSATPSIESFYACATRENWTRVDLPARANGKTMPKITLVDMAREFSSGHKSMFSRPLTHAMKRELGLNRKVVLLLNQRGFAKFMLCRDCGFVPECNSCSTSLTYHEKEHVLMCHHCGHEEAVPAVCPKCGSPYLRLFGAGTQRVEAELEKFVSSEPTLDGRVCVVRMDADTTKTKGAHQKLLESFAAPGPAILLGTQMIAKGLDFEDVTLVGVINADTSLHLPDYRAEERTFNLIEQVAGRAGRAHLSGEVVVQSYDPSVSALARAANYDQEHFVQEQLEKRQAMDFPPFCRMANILVWGENENTVRQAAEQLYEDLARFLFGEAYGTLYEDLDSPELRGINLSPATSCVLSRLKGAYRFHIIFTCPSNEDPAALIGPFFRSRKTLKNVRIAVDIDPQSLL